MVWKSVSRLDVVMRLVEGAKVEFIHATTPHNYRIMITFPSNPDLSRYDRYASWIQELEIYGGYYQEIINPNSLLTLLGGRPLLPNLRRLTAYTTAPVDARNLIDFFSMFTSPSLTEIRTIIPNKGLPQTSSSRVPSSSAPVFLERLKDICPQIEVLEFYPESTSAGDWPERYIPSDQSRNTLSSFSNLRSFSSTTYILESAILSILGELPHLESLGIRGSPRELPVLDKQLSVPETWFPVLKDLRLYDVDPEDIQVLWNQHTIIKKLTSLLIQTDDSINRYAPDSPLYGKNWVGTFLQALPHLSPQLQGVAFYMGDLDGRVEIPRDYWGVFEGERVLYFAFHAFTYLQSGSLL
ncbi:hypothetical protein FRC11_000114 [Ceratobasidium sp. 423]|nr:hypothetical protein FRC11_000114 [Ceratobasidium sp. 423]